MKDERLINNLLAKKKWGLYLYLVRLYLSPFAVCLTRPELWTTVLQCLDTLQSSVLFTIKRLLLIIIIL
jgi:hypothetical protein